MLVLCIGEAMIELALSPDGGAASIGVAGDALNTAIYLRRNLSSEHTVAFGTAVGSDAMSDRILAFAEGHGINCSQVRRNPARNPGLYAIHVDDEGERYFTYWRDSSAARTMFGPDDAPEFGMLEGADVIVFSAITLAILSPKVRNCFLIAIAAARERGTRIVFDSNYRPKLWDSVQTAREAVLQAWALTDLGFPSIDDEMNLFDEDEETAETRLRSYAMEVCILKRGARGPKLLTPSDSLPAITTDAALEVVDTTGAGDSFNGSFLAVYFDNHDVGAAMQAAHETAMRVVGTRGAILP
jgi:2-dehydro-3-deoxygluconokinase